MSDNPDNRNYKEYLLIKSSATSTDTERSVNITVNFPGKQEGSNHREIKGRL